MEMTWIWVLIPIAAIATKAFRGWLQFKATQRQLGASNQELEREVAEVRRTNETLLERIQNLEAIVVSQTWDALHDTGLAPAERELKVASVARRELRPPEPSAANQQRAEQLARRLQG
ncbi:MAG: hypothetical protein QOF89_295 [Acidobacteriota bacterium]|jgi:hypothetical protein|nr:hypothetical protein [Acidobacteriota bacterium]